MLLNTSFQSCQFPQGILNKYTNWASGYQQRYFVIDTQRGRLEYYLTNLDANDRAISPRGGVALYGASILPDPEHSSGFQIMSVNGNIFKLKANNTRERQRWITLLRSSTDSNYTYNKVLPQQLPFNSNNLLKQNNQALSNVSRTKLINKYIEKNKPDFSKNVKIVINLDPNTNQLFIKSVQHCCNCLEKVQNLLFKFDSYFKFYNYDEEHNLEQNLNHNLEIVKNKSYFESIKNRLEMLLVSIIRKHGRIIKTNRIKKNIPQTQNIVQINTNNFSTTNSYSKNTPSMDLQQGKRSDDIYLNPYININTLTNSSNTNISCANLNLSSSSKNKPYSKRSNSTEKEIFKMKTLVSDSIGNSLKAIGLTRTIGKLDIGDIVCKPSIRKTSSNSESIQSESISPLNNINNTRTTKSLNLPKTNNKHSHNIKYDSLGEKSISNS